MQTITLIPPSAASIIASAANAGGTKIIDTSAPVFSTASATELNRFFQDRFGLLYQTALATLVHRNLSFVQHGMA